MKMLGLFLFFLLSCGKFGNKDKPSVYTPTLRDLTFDKLQIYRRSSQARMEDSGYFRDLGCDSLLFASLASASGVNVPIENYRSEDGKWFRTPEHNCYDEKRSSSDISKDMFTGLWWALYTHSKRSLIDELIQYGEGHEQYLFWIMGRGDISRVGIPPPAQATWYEMRYRLGGKDNANRFIPQIWSKLDGFESHLQVIHILLLGRLTSQIDDHAKSRLKEYALREPENALYQAAWHLYYDGNMDSAYRILLSESKFPALSLPTSDNYCTEYLFQRDMLKNGGVNPDWLPCPHENKQYSGIDFLFAAKIALGE